LLLKSYYMIKNFTKTAILCLVIGTSFTACKKDSNTKPPASNDTYSMKFTSNGTAVSYNTCAVADVEVNSNKYTEFIGLNGKNTDNSFQVEVVADYTKLKAGQTYKVTADYLAQGTAILFYSPNGTNYFNSQPEAPEGTVTITEATSTTVKGTFSGKLYSADDYSGTTLKYTITNGTFVAQMPYGN